MAPRIRTRPPEAPGRLAFWPTIRRLSRRQWLYLPRLLSARERNLVLAAAALALVAFGAFATLGIRRVTVERPAVGGELREGVIGEPRFANPLYATSDTDRDLTELVFSKIIRYAGGNEPELDLAEGLEVSPDATIYTIRLRQGIRWHDGERFDADDVIFTIKAVQDPEYQSPLRANWQGVAVEKIDAATLRLTLRQPYAPFMENLALGILPEHLWRKIPRESAVLSDLNLKPIGTGPYRFRKFSRRDDGTVTSITLTRNRRYHLTGPYLNEMRLIMYPSEERLVAAYRRNEIDGFAFGSAASREEMSRLDATTHELVVPKLFAVFLNSSASPALGRQNVRKALATALDRPAIIAQSEGDGAPVDSPIPPGVFGASPDIAPIPYDPEAARALLAADGWKDAKADGVLERTEGSGRNRKTVELTVRLSTSDAPELAVSAEAIAEFWRAIGARVEVSALPVGELESAVIRPRAYEALLFGEIFGHDPDPYAFWHTSQLKDPGLNIALYSNRAADQLLEEARRAGDPQAREARYRQFQKIVSDDLGAIFLYRPVRYYALRRTVRAMLADHMALPGERFAAANQWYTDTRRALK